MSQASRARQSDRNKRYTPSFLQPALKCRALDKAKLAEFDEANPQHIVTFSNGTVQQLQPNGSLKTVGILPKVNS